MKTIKELEYTADEFEGGYIIALKDVLELIDEVVIVPSIKDELKARIEG